VDLIQTVLSTAVVGMTTGLAGSYVVHRWLRGRADAAVLEETAGSERNVPRSLHPVVDPDLCIGSLACIRACPEGDVLGMVDGIAGLIRGQDCIGHGVCAAECPVSAITLVFGTAKRGIDLPEVDANFESSRPGVHVVGELGGMGLIKNAMRQGLQVADHLAQARHPAEPGVVDVCIVGAGPAGLAAALALTHHKMSFRLLEQDTLASTIAHYPRRKLVMTEPVHLPIWGKFGRKRIHKEELLDTFQKVIRKARIQVEQGVKVLGVDGRDGDFTVSTTGGPVRARKVVLAIGRRGSPRKLGVPGEEQAKVVYRLDHPEQYDGARVLVVGAGDSGVEAACQLARESKAAVGLSFRGDAPRCREPNRADLANQSARGRLRLLPRSQVQRIGVKDVTLEIDGRAETLANDFVIVNVGGELPADFLQKAGVEMRRYHGEAPGSRVNGPHRPSAQELELRRNERRLELAFALVGAAILIFMAWRGWAYYALSPLARLKSPLHASFRPAGPWGHGVGVVATIFMLSNLLYAVRKRVPALSGVGNMRYWMAFHVFVGFMSPLVIAFHAAFQSRNTLATSTAAALAVVMLTGIVGRYIFGLVPAAAGRALEVEELQGRLVRARTDVEPLLAMIPAPGPAKRLFDAVTEPLPPGSFLPSLVRYPLRTLRSRAALRRCAGLFPDEASWEAFRDDLLQCEKLRLQIGFYRSLKRLMAFWRILHASLAAFLVLTMAAHIGFSLYLGFGVK
jgi:thioredoxin reductase/Pyruvate/2-oxoacid:ferredoxin oxidoreductase delta subunit